MRVRPVPHVRGDEPADLKRQLLPDYLFPTCVGMNRSFG